MEEMQRRWLACKKTIHELSYYKAAATIHSRWITPTYSLTHLVKVYPTYSLNRPVELLLLFSRDILLAINMGVLRCIFIVLFALSAYIVQAQDPDLDGQLVEETMNEAVLQEEGTETL